MAKHGARVLIHSQGESEAPLREAIEHYRPQIVFLISNKDNKFRDVIFNHLVNKNTKYLGQWVVEVEHSEMILIEDAWSDETIMQMFTAIDEAKKRAHELADGRILSFYSGVAGGTKLMVIGSALAAINGGISTYYVNKEMPGQSSKLLFEIGFMNHLMAAINWLKHGRYNEKKNLRYLSEVIRREESGQICTAEEMATTLAPTVPKSIRNAMRVLKDHGLVEIEGIKPQEYSSTRLGHYVLSMFQAHDEEE
ncbi:MAG: hypothetical protein VX906_05050 [Candidatus Thermoplasmatota archaeon]|nr:hypothetical protein [Candidatus Thermoplasmatota archaeon]